MTNKTIRKWVDAAMLLENVFNLVFINPSNVESTHCFRISDRGVKSLWNASGRQINWVARVRILKTNNGRQNTNLMRRT